MQEDGYGEKIRGGQGKKLADAIATHYRKLGLGDDRVRSEIIGHKHRSGPPCEVDRVRGYRYGVGAMELVHEGQWGKMIGYMEGKYVVVSLDTATEMKRVTDLEYDQKRYNARLSTVDINDGKR